MSKKAIIIGAGPAGLTAAYELLKKDHKNEVIILEELNSVGGIAKTVNYKGNRMDLGGHRFFTKSQEINDLWEELMPDDKEFLVRNRVSRIYYLRKFFDYPISINLETIKKLGFVRTIQSGFSYLKSCIFKKKETNLENFYINRFGKKLYGMFFEDYTEKLWGRHPREISADWGNQRVKGISIRLIIANYFKKIFHIKNKKQETSLIEKFQYPKHGPGQLWEVMKNRIEEMGGKIIFDAKVDKINVKNNKITSVVAGGKEYKGDVFISSMPIKDLVNSLNTKCDKKIKDIANNLPYRDFVTIGVLIKKLNFKEDIKDCWIYVQEKNVKMGRIQVFNNWSPYMVKDKKTAWIGLEYFCAENDDFWNMSEKECAEFAIDELIKMNIIKDSSDVLDFHREKVKKAYPAYFDSYSEIDKVIKYLNQYENLYCIGRNGQHRYNNMDHSMLCAIEAVKLITNNKKDKTELWNVNTEQEYHESK